MNQKVAIEVTPIVDGEYHYYKTVIFDFLESGGSAHKIRVVRDIFHHDDLPGAVEHLHKMLLDGSLQTL